MTNPKSAPSHRRRLRFLPTPRDRRIIETVRVHGRLTGRQIRQLFFRHPGGRLASAQAVNARLRKLVDMDCLEPVVISGGYGSGPYAYGLAFRGRAFLGGVGTTRRPRGAGAIWHQLEIADFRIAIQHELESEDGELIEWLGEPVLRGLLIGRRGTPVPDALIHWRLGGREGAVLLEWDRGSESLAVLTAKIRTYVDHWRVRAHRELIPGLGLKPRLAVVLDSQERALRLTRWLAEQQARTLPATVLIGIAKSVLVDPLGDLWWRSDTGQSGSFHN